MKKNHPITEINKAKNCRYSKYNKGFTLIELMIAMAVGLVVLSAVYAVFTVQNKELNKQEQIAVMQQNARMAMEMMTREIMMAGYGNSAMPRCSGTTSTSSTTCVGITAANANSISFSTDLNDTGVLGGPNEYMTYDLYTSSGIQTLGRVANGSRAPVVENVSSLNFFYYDASEMTTTSLANIRRIQITITTQTAYIDPVLGAVRTYTLTSNVTPRNLGMAGY